MTSPDAPIEIVSYDAVWPKRFEVEAALLRLPLAPWRVGPIDAHWQHCGAGLRSL
jgi:hypothetical protein